jgi:prepilin-type N-terminal cleavage/methylation domain-containing protein
METYLLGRKLRRERGFTLAETLVALVVLTVGLVGMATLMSQTMSTSSQSDYMSRAAVLASEKLEDLNRYPDSDPAVTVPAGNGTAGDLNNDVSQPVTVNGNTETVDYYDSVQLSSTNGSMLENVVGGAGAGNASNNSTTYRPDGTVVVAVGPAPPVMGTTMVSFKRRWIIEQDQPLAGVKRVTVRVILQTSSDKRVLPFQMSLVRP